MLTVCRNGKLPARLVPAGSRGRSRVSGRTRRVRGRRSQVWLDLADQLVLAPQADPALHFLALRVQDQRRDALDAEPPADLGMLVDVELCDLDALVGLGDVLQDRRDRTAGRAPLGPEVHEHG